VTMAKSFALPEDVSCRSRRIKVRQCHLRGLSRLPVKYLLRGLFFGVEMDLRDSVLMVLQGQPQTEIRNSFGVAEGRLVARFPIVFRPEQRNQRQDNEKSRH
jgi:hypothetical protein